MRKAFTLIELLVSFAAGLLIFTAVLGLFSIGRRTIDRGGAQSEITQNGRVALERISRELRQAQALVTRIPETATVPGFPPPSSLEFEDGHDGSALNYIRYHLEGALLYREVSYYSFSSAPTTHVSYTTRDAYGNPPTKTVTTDEIIAEGFTKLEFFGDKTVTIRETLGTPISSTFQTTVTARNVPGSGN